MIIESALQYRHNILFQTSPQPRIPFLGTLHTSLSCSHLPYRPPAPTHFGLHSWSPPPSNSALMWCPQSPVHCRYLQSSHRSPSRSHLCFHERRQGLNGQMLDPEWQALQRKLSIIQGPPLPKNRQPPLSPESHLHGRKAKLPDNRKLWFKSMGLQAGNGSTRLISGWDMSQSPWGPAWSSRAEGCLFSIQYQPKSSTPPVCDCHHHIPPHTIDGARIYITTENWRRGHRDSSRKVQKKHKVTHILGTPPSANLQGKHTFHIRGL